MGDKARPFRVWDARRQKKHSLVAESLAEVISKGKGKLNISEEETVCCVLERDGTAVDDDEYWQCLEDHTVLMLLLQGQQWTQFVPGDDETDFAIGSAPSDPLSNAVAMLQRDKAQLLLFSEEDHRAIVTTSVDELHARLGMTLEEASRIHDACQRHLDDVEEFKDAKAVLNLLRQQSNSSEVAESASKKQRTNDVT